MIFGIGIDIFEIKRMERNLGNASFMKEVFHPSEIKSGAAKEKKAQYFSGLFCAKEAFYKACGTEIQKNLSFKDAVVKSTKSGSPQIVVSKKIRGIFKDNCIEKIHVSLSHTAEYATAIVILESRI